MKNNKHNRYTKLFQRFVIIPMFCSLIVCINGCGAILFDVVTDSEGRQLMLKIKEDLIREQNNSVNNIEITHHQSWEDAVYEYIYINRGTVDSLLKLYPIMEAGFDIKVRNIYIGKLNPGIYLITFYRDDRKSNKHYYKCKRVVIKQNEPRQHLVFGSSSGLIESSFKQSIQEFNEEYGSHASREILKISGIDPNHDLNYYYKFVNEQYYKNLINTQLKEKKINQIKNYFELFSGKQISAEQLYNYCNAVINENTINK